MRYERWGVAVNGYFGTASVYRERGPLWTFAVEWLLLHCTAWVPHWRVPLIGRLRLIRDGEHTNIADWYGDTLDQLLVYSWFNDAYGWIWKKRQHHTMTIPLRHLLDAFKDGSERFWREEWERGTKMWQEGSPNGARSEVLRDAAGNSVWPVTPPQRDPREQKESEQ